MDDFIDEMDRKVKEVSEKLDKIKEGDLEERKGSEKIGGKDERKTSDIHENSRLEREQMEDMKSKINETSDKIKKDLWEKVKDPHSNYPGFQSDKNQERQVRDEKKSEKSVKKEVETEKKEEENETSVEEYELNRFYEKIEFTKHKIIDGHFKQAKKMYNSLLKDFRRLNDKDIAGEKEKRILKGIYSRVNET